MRPNSAMLFWYREDIIILLYSIHYGRIVLYNTLMVLSIVWISTCVHLFHNSEACNFYVKLLWFCNLYSITMQNTVRTNLQCLLHNTTAKYLVTAYYRAQKTLFPASSMRSYRLWPKMALHGCTWGQNMQISDVSSLAGLFKSTIVNPCMQFSCWSNEW